MTVTKTGKVLVDLGTVGAVTVTPEIRKGNYFRVTCSAATLTIAAPIMGTRESPGPPPDNLVTVPVLGNVEVGDEIYIEVKNASGGALTVTWNAAFKGAPGNPATANRRVHIFVWDGANWVLVNSTTADVPN